ncbi:diaminopimelate decarboxylase [Dendrosporobacter quercicolus]|uniref:Diaminopimelate decarboxylase n=1 Tax=Dendrosporobacter quercicolus TaxID=146817 RepID=A0A1G9L1Z9_9FIRM|nr:diaminopimelate decarboxylase [Dendrosporobacter quercicolus]SDL56008.1 diaminopimelate decarboxylase [Dendrosporobacter quercicolus]
MMKLYGSMKSNPAGHLEIGGCDAVTLAAEFGTPLYVMDEEQIRANCRAYVHSFARHYPNSEVVYASKVFSTVAMCRLAEEENMGLDVVSGGELYTALQAGFPADRIYFHGNNKTAPELLMAIDAKVGRIVVDNLHELELLNELAAARKTAVSIMLRVSPGIDAHTHHYIKTGMIDSKFGLAIANGQALAAVRAALARENLAVHGFHCHIGSQIFDLKSYTEAAESMMSFVREASVQTGFIAKELNLGGGLGIFYTEGDTPQPIERFVQEIVKAVTVAAGRYDLPRPKIIVEPGRSIVGEAGVTLYTVGSIKEIPGVRKYVAVDGGMTDNPRPALYQAQYEAALANKINHVSVQTVSIAGKCCESGDMLIWDIELPVVEPGDILVVAATGAYNYSMASNYNRNLRPAVVFVQNGKADLIVRRETYEAIIQNDVLPERMRKLPAQY